MKRVVIKIGTNAMIPLGGTDMTIDERLLKYLVAQCAKACVTADVLIVSSGAMGCGHTLMKLGRHDAVTIRQMYAVVGQVKLMSLYAKFFGKHGLNVAQMLATKNDFTNRAHYLNTKNCLESLFKEKIVPVMNENDFVAVEELMFTDNDELAGMAAKMIGADRMIMLTNVDGVFDEKGKVISEFGLRDCMPKHLATADKSSFGKGGIQNKFKVAKAVAESGTEVVIANSRAKNVIGRILKGEKVGTKFKAKK